MPVNSVMAVGVALKAANLCAEAGQKPPARSHEATRDPGQAGTFKADPSQRPTGCWIKALVAPEGGPRCAC
jgi:hypothetical protein